MTDARRPHVNAFDFLHGSWTVEHSLRRDRLAGSSEWDHRTGWAVCAPILGGAGQLDQIWLPHRDAIGCTLRLFDSVTDRWRLHWSSSDAPRLDPPLEGRFDNGVGHFTGRDDLRGRPIDVRFVWDQITHDHARWTQSFAWAESTQWEPNYVMEFRRTSEHAASATTGPLPLDTTQ